MSTPTPPSIATRILGLLLLLTGAAVFLVRFQHEGPYAFPGGGNLRAGLLALFLGAWLVRDWIPADRVPAALGWLAVGTAPVVLFFALYSTLAELEEVITLHATDSEGRPADLRLWIVDKEGEAWVTMQRTKADEHSLDGARLELLRDGGLHCVIPRRDDRREVVNEIHHLRHGKYAVQRIATVLGLFAEDASDTTVALHLEPCPPAGGA